MSADRDRRPESNLSVLSEAVPISKSGPSAFKLKESSSMSRLSFDAETPNDLQASSISGVNVPFSL